MTIELPPAPATAAEAVKQANQLAYGFEKHKDVAYWGRYLEDPTYFWKRLLGWQAGGADIAVYGLYAEPPSPWNHGAQTGPDPTLPPVDTSFSAILARLDFLSAQVSAITFPTYTGSVFGVKITLTPK